MTLLLRTVVVVAVLVASAVATPPPGYVKKLDNDENPPSYQYKYVIEAGKGESQGKSEEREGELASGRYYVNSKRASTDVKYIADEWGYHPLVKYESSDDHSKASASFALGEKAVQGFDQQSIGQSTPSFPISKDQGKIVQIIQPYHRAQQITGENGISSSSSGAASGSSSSSSSSSSNSSIEQYSSSSSSGNFNNSELQQQQQQSVYSFIPASSDGVYYAAHAPRQQLQQQQQQQDYIHAAVPSSSGNDIYQSTIIQEQSNGLASGNDLQQGIEEHYNHRLVVENAAHFGQRLQDTRAHEAYAYTTASSIYTGASSTAAQDEITSRYYGRPNPGRTYLPDVIAARVGSDFSTPSSSEAGVSGNSIEVGESEASSAAASDSATSEGEAGSELTGSRDTEHAFAQPIVVAEEQQEGQKKEEKQEEKQQEEAFQYSTTFKCEDDKDGGISSTPDPMMDTDSSHALNPIQAGVSLANAGEAHLIVSSQDLSKLLPAPVIEEFEDIPQSDQASIHSNDIQDQPSDYQSINPAFGIPQADPTTAPTVEPAVIIQKSIELYQNSSIMSVLAQAQALQKGQLLLIDEPSQLQLHEQLLQQQEEHQKLEELQMLLQKQEEEKKKKKKKQEQLKQLEEQKQHEEEEQKVQEEQKQPEEQKQEEEQKQPEEQKQEEEEKKQEEHHLEPGQWLEEIRKPEEYDKLYTIEEFEEIASNPQLLKKLYEIDIKKHAKNAGAGHEGYVVPPATYTVEDGAVWKNTLQAEKSEEKSQQSEQSEQSQQSEQSEQKEKQQEIKQEEIKQEEIKTESIPYNVAFQEEAQPVHHTTAFAEKIYVPPPPPPSYHPKSTILLPVEKYVEKPPLPLPVEKFIEHIYPVKVEKVVNRKVYPYPVLEASKPAFVNQAPYGVKYGVSYQQIMKPKAQGLYSPQTPNQLAPLYALSVLNNNNNNNNNNNYNQPQQQVYNGNFNRNLGSLNQNQGQSSQGYVYDKPINPFYDGKDPYLGKKSPYNLYAPATSYLPTNSLLNRRHTAVQSAGNKYRQDDYTGPVPPPLFHHHHHQHKQQQPPPPPPPPQRQYSHPTKSFGASYLASIDRSQNSRQGRNHEAPRPYQKGNFRQSKIEYGFKPPMVPSVQYDEETASKVES